jgi:hypothetical protein
MNDTQDVITSLYSSADPLCAIAARFLEDKEKLIDQMDDELTMLATSCRLMMEALMEIHRVSVSRDSASAKEITMLLKELNLRLKECGSIANDTLNLQTIQTVFKGYYY